MDETETPEHPGVEPESQDNLALHFGRMEAEHAQMRREWATERAAMDSLRAQVQELRSSLTEVEATAEQILEEHPQEASLDAEEDHRAPATASEPRKPHWLARALTGQ